MSLSILIAISFSLGFFVESIIGFGGSLIAYAILGFFIDAKQMILWALYIATCASIYILITDHKSFSKKVFINSLPICLLGTMIGVLIFTRVSSHALLISFGALSIILSAKVIFFDTIKFPKLLRSALLLLGGISQGLFGIGGPFLVNSLKDEFKTKSEIRTTMAVFFITLNIIRFIQLSLENQLPYSQFKEIWWVIFPVFIAIYFGFKAHLKISEVFFKKMIGTMTFFAGIIFLLK